MTDVPAMVRRVVGRGAPVVPCGADKRPLIRWKEFQSRLPTEDELKGWAELGPSAWAVVTGKISGLLVLDFDCSEGLQTLERLGLRPHVSTGSGGAHVYFAHPGWFVRTVNSKAKHTLGEKYPGLDIWADGGYAIFEGRNSVGEYRLLRKDGPEALSKLPPDLRGLLGLDRPEQGQTPQAAFSIPVGERISTDQLLSRALGMVGSDGRNNSGFWLATQMRDNGYAKPETLVTLRSFAGRCPLVNTKGRPEPYNDGEICSTIDSVYSQSPRDPWSRASRTASDGSATQAVRRPKPTGEARQVRKPDSELALLPLNDDGNAQRLIARFGDRIRYCDAERCWYCWTGTHWARDETREVDRLANKTSRAIFTEVAALNDVGDRTKLAKWALQSGMNKARHAMIDAARSMVPITPAMLDADPWLLTVRNGTVNLQTGKIQPHSLDDYITRCAPVDFDPNARLDLWEDFLDYVTHGNKEFQAFLQRAIGYSLTGDTREEKLFLIYGSGASGKSTFLDAIKSALGPYAHVADFETFLSRPHGSSHRTDVADLRGARFVCSVEVDDGKTMAQALVKNLTGGDEITVRSAYGRSGRTFRPTCKLWLSANHAPRIHHDDDAMWRRVLRVPFNRVIPEKERKPWIKSQLRKPEVAGAAVFAWAVKGCLTWKKDGLQVPTSVLEDTDAYREEMNPLGVFIEERCKANLEQPEDYWAVSERLWANYQSFVRDSGEKFPLGRKAFLKTLSRLGFKSDVKKVDGKTTRIRRGISLLGHSGVM